MKMKVGIPATLLLHAITTIQSLIPSSEWAVQVKSDSSPLTIADSKANALICSELTRIAPHIPIVSEETKLVSYETRSSYKLWWCVDPLDGTKEFIKRNGQV